MFKLVLEKAEEPEIKLLTSVRSSRKQRSSRKTSTSALFTYAKAFDCVDHNKLWKILKGMGIPDHLTCDLRNLYVGQEATVWTLHRTTDWFKIGKRIRQGYILAPCFTYMQSISCKMQSWMNHKLESRLLREISVASDMQMTPPLWQKLKRN